MADNRVQIVLEAEASRLRAAMAESSAAVQQASETIKGAMSGMADHVRASVSQATQSINGSGGLASGLRDAGGQMGVVAAAASRLDQALRATMIGAVTTLVGSLAAAAKASADFEQSIFQMHKTFGDASSVMIGKAKTMSDQMAHYFSRQEIQYAFVKTADSMQRYGIQGQQYLDLVARASDVAAAKGMSLKESIDRLESAMRGEAEASEYLGVTLNDTYMKTIAFNGKLKEHWETMTETSKATYRYVEMLQQTEKYAGSAKDVTVTLTGALQGFWNTLKDNATILDGINSRLARFINLMTGAISAPSAKNLSERALDVIQTPKEDLFGPSDAARQAAQMDYRDLLRVTQVGKTGITGQGITLPEPVVDPEKLIKKYKSALQDEEDALMASGKAKDWSASQEVAYWQEKLKTAKEGSEEAKQVYHELAVAVGKAQKEEEKERKAGRAAGKAADAEARKDAREKYQADMADMRLQLEGYRKNGEERIKIAHQMAARAAREYGQESRQHKEMLRLVEQEERKHQEEMERLQEERLEGEREAAKERLDLEAENIRAMREMGQISAQQEIQALLGLEQRKYEIEFLALQQRMKLRDKDAIDQQKTFREMERLQNRHRLRMNQLEHHMEMDSKKTWTDIAKTMSQTFGNAVKGVITGTMTLSQAMQSIFGSIVDMIIDKIMEMITQWIIGMFTAKTASVGSGMASAGEGAAAAGASVAHIPFIGWAMVPAVTATTFALLSSYAMMGLASAAGGWEVPEDTIAQVHKNEMVLPAHLSDRIRNMTEPASRAQVIHQHHYTIQAQDSADVKRFLKRHAGALAGGAKRATRDFRFRGALS